MHLLYGDLHQSCTFVTTQSILQKAHKKSILNTQYFVRTMLIGVILGLWHEEFEKKTIVICLDQDVYFGLLLSTKVLCASNGWCHNYWRHHLNPSSISKNGKIVITQLITCLSFGLINICCFHFQWLFFFFFGI
jgi:hypothetical protein